jgi:hypothetical protein
MAWWYSHMTRMLAAYIATVTAFSVVNFEFLPRVVRWLWATVAGTVGIVIWTRYYRRKFSDNGAAPNAPGNELTADYADFAEMEGNLETDSPRICAN